jgi:hypothetical protein
MFRISFNKINIFIALICFFIFSQIPAIAHEVLRFKSLETRIKNTYDVVPAMAVFNLSRYFKPQTPNELAPELYLYVIYAKGLPAGLGNRDVTLKKIKRMVRLEINSDTLMVPPLSLEKEVGMANSYDFVVFVVSPFDNFIWMNSNGYPVELTPEAPTEGISVHLAIDYLRKDQIDQFIKSQAFSNKATHEMIYTFTFGK